jgi:hypothetical protein
MSRHALHPEAYGDLDEIRGYIQLPRRLNIRLLLDHIAVMPVKHVRIAVTRGFGSKAGMLGFGQMVRTVAVPQAILLPRLPLLSRRFLR